MSACFFTSSDFRFRSVKGENVPMQFSPKTLYVEISIFLLIDSRTHRMGGVNMYSNYYYYYLNMSITNLTSNGMSTRFTKTNKQLCPIYIMQMRPYDFNLLKRHFIK